jgi:hypothetical protein
MGLSAASVWIKWAKFFERQNYLAHKRWPILKFSILILRKCKALERRFFKQ